MEQGRRLVALERRFDALDAARRADREALTRAVVRLEDEVYRLRRKVDDLERAHELDQVPRQLALEVGA